MAFRNREDAGRQLALELKHFAGRQDLVVLGLPRGGVPVAAEVAWALRAPLDVFVVRKLGVPGHEELAMGAVASGGAAVLNHDVLRALLISKASLGRIEAEQRQELERRERLYRGDLPPLDVTGKTVILVDDGLATGASMRAAVAALRKRHAKRIVVAVPVAPPEACREIGEVADDVVCAVTPEPFYGVGNWYEDFSQTTDEEVRGALEPPVPELPGR